MCRRMCRRSLAVSCPSFADSFEAFLKVIDYVLTSMNVPYSYGFSIIVLTLLVKLATYPLSAKQVESTLRMQQLQPAVKELQAKYANDQERLQAWRRPSCTRRRG